MSPEVASTLDVWDARLDEAGTALAEAREALVEQLVPLVTRHYARLAGQESKIGMEYRRSWEGRLLEALGRSRTKDLERGVTLLGPHRDELELSLAGLPGRTHASQGEQRSLALALQLAAHQLATERLGSAPVLLLDDVFSELDPFRSKALLAGLPPGQALLTTALPAPPEVAAAKVYTLDGGGRVGPGHPGRAPGEAPGDRTVIGQ
jgi:DNA replication and repair protein RecF